MKCVGGLNHKKKQRPTSYTNNIHSQVPEGRYQGVAASLWPVATVEGAEFHCICIKKTCYEYEVCGGLNHKKKQRPTSYTNNIHSQVPEKRYQGVAASLLSVATVEGAELHYICIKKTCYEYEVCGGSQS